MTRLCTRMSLAAAIGGFSLFAFLVSTSRADNAPAETTAAAAPAAKSTAEAKLSRYAFGAEAGSAGYGPVFVFTLSKSFTASLGYTWLSYSHTVTASDADYDGKLKFSNLQALFSWHPWSGCFHLSAGGFIANDKLEVTGRPEASGSYKVGDGVYSATQIGTLKGQSKLINGFAPYLGIGWSKTPGKSGFGAFIDLGVVFISSPRADLAVTGPIATDATFQGNLRKDQQDLNDKLKDYRYCPIIQAGLLYRF